MTNPATNTEMGNDNSNGLSGLATTRSVRFLDQHLHAKTGPEPAAATVVTASTAAATATTATATALRATTVPITPQGNTGADVLNPYAKKTPPDHQTPPRVSTMMDLANTKTPFTLKDILPPIPTIPIHKQDLIDTKNEKEPKKKNNDVRKHSALATDLVSLPEALHEPIKRLAQPAKEYSL
jgi:hypothetical protein